MGTPLLLEKRKGILLYLLFLRLVGKSLSTLCSTSLQYLSTCGGSHSLTETVYFALLSFLGLIGSFHDFFS